MRSRPYRDPQVAQEHSPRPGAVNTYFSATSSISGTTPGIYADAGNAANQVTVRPVGGHIPVGVMPRSHAAVTASPAAVATT